MSKHSPTATPTDDGRWVSSCTCRWYTPKIKDTHHEAEDLGLAHLKEVEKQRAYTRRTPPSLKESRDYYRKQAESDEWDEPTQRLWRQLADEIDHRLNDGPPAADIQPRLW